MLHNMETQVGAIQTDAYKNPEPTRDSRIKALTIYLLSCLHPVENPYSEQAPTVGKGVQQQVAQLTPSKALQLLIWCSLYSKGKTASALLQTILVWVRDCK